MKINDSSVHINFEAYAQKTKDAAGTADRAPAPSGDTGQVDKVVLSPKAREIQEARKLLEEVPDVNEPKVSELHLKVETGVYEIDGSRIAERMLREMALNQNYR
jgi:flagellar biosynthesis anti-sigma factor FlgM